MKINVVQNRMTISILITIFFVAEIHAQSAEHVLQINLKDCIELTLKNNNSKSSLLFAEKAAEARLKQAQSGRYPSLDLTAALTALDQDPNYIVPESKIQIPAINLGTFSIPSLAMPVPTQDIKLADKQNIQADLNLVWPLFTGGKISSYVDQAEKGISIAKNDTKINDDQIIYDTKKLYYSVLLSVKLEDIAKEAYERLEATLSVTESLFQNGSGRVTKTDYLKNKMMAEALNGMYIQISGEHKTAVAALINTMGLDWQTQIELTENEIPFNKIEIPLADLLNNMYDSNPLFAKVENALNVYQYRIDEANSDYWPSLALIGGFHRTFNKYDYGMVTINNKNIWMIGLGLKMNIFNGFRTSAKVEENKAELDQLTQQKEFLKKGLTLKLQYIYQKMISAAERENSSKEAMQSSIENRELIEKAYFNDIMELQDLLTAQLTETFFKAQYEMVLFDHADYCAQLENLLSQN